LGQTGRAYVVMLERAGALRRFVLEFKERHVRQ
jgi:hypothetical protein